MGVYAVGSDQDSMVKIGFTSKTKPEGRMRDMQTGFRGARPIRLAWAPMCSMEDEKRLHGLLKCAGAWKSLEWFDGEHPATKIVIDRLNKGQFGLAIRYLETFIREKDDISQPWAHKAVINEQHISLHNCSKTCSACARTLPLIDAHWGTLWIRDPKGSLRDQPQCMECRFAKEHYRDDKTHDMFEALPNG